LHQMTARVDRGEDFTPPPPWDVDVKAYRDLLAAASVTICPEWIERTCVIPDLNLAGTFDRIVEVRDRLWIADLKTGRDLSYSWGEIAIQLACYAHASHIWDWETNALWAMPEVDRRRGLIIHLPVGKGTASLHVVDLEAGWEAATQAAWVRDWRARKDLSRVVNV
ncbi:MAG: PD-(D/E)XK nuclease family protein, partial [Candidatus Methylomirabilales bacterium]